MANAPTSTIRSYDLESGSEEERVWLAMKEIYSQSLAGEVQRVTELMHADVTLWDSETEQLAFGVPHLLELRSGQPQRKPKFMPIALDASEPVVDVWGDVAVLRHRLVVRFADGEGEEVRIRNTSAWRLTDGQWQLAHNHEDVQ